MAALTRRVVKVTLVTAGTIPVIGLIGGVSALNKDEPEDESPRLVRACDLPLYDVARTKNSKEETVETSLPNSVEKLISSARAGSSDVILSVTNSYASVKSKVETGVNHSKSKLEYVQTNPDELPRIAFVSVSTMGGFVLGYRGSILRKVLYAGIAAASSAALCYPTFTVGLTGKMADEVKQFWKDNFAWTSTNISNSSGGKKEVKLMRDRNSGLQGDVGQSSTEDQDMYSTRS